MHLSCTLTCFAKILGIFLPAVLHQEVAEGPLRDHERCLAKLVLGIQMGTALQQCLDRGLLSAVVGHLVGIVQGHREEQRSVAILVLATQ